MRKNLIAGLILIFMTAIIILAGCDKERIVESTEYVEKIEYVTLPPDTIIMVDTLFSYDTVSTSQTDTVHVIDTIIQINYVYDTVTQINYVYDTVTNVQYVYDTAYITQTDTVTIASCDPNEELAFAAMQYHSNLVVVDVVTAELGNSNGWIYYLTSYQLDMAPQSSNVYDIYGYLNYWFQDWSDVYAFEFYWRMTYTGGDPSNPNNWQMTDPPGASPEKKPGVNLIETPTERNLSR